MHSIIESNDRVCHVVQSVRDSSLCRVHGMPSLTHTIDPCTNATIAYVCTNDMIVAHHYGFNSCRCGTEPVEGILLYHTAWTGPLTKYREEFGALLDSWLMTQDTAQSEFHFWWMDRDPDPEDEFVKHYSDIGRGKILFHRVDLHAMAKGTCLEGKAEYLNASVPSDWHSKGVMGPKEKADLTRILLLNHYGG